MIENLFSKKNEVILSWFDDGAILLFWNSKNVQNNPAVTK